MRRPSLAAITGASAIATLVLAGPALAREPVLFSQTASSASVTPVSANKADVVLKTGGRPLVVFEQRPGTRTGTVPERAFTGLWQATFKTDAPNAVLTGLGPGGRDRRAIVRLEKASQVKGGVRYRVRYLRGSLPATLHPANLMIDSVPLSAFTAYLDGNTRTASSWVPLINALSFPSVAQPVAQEQVDITPGAPFAVAVSGPPVVLMFSSVQWWSDSAMSITNAGDVVFTFVPAAGQGCAMPDDLTWTVVAVPGPSFTASTIPGGACAWQWTRIPTGASLVLLRRFDPGVPPSALTLNRVTISAT